ncbi:MAG: GAF domain-containing protein [Lachnospiraceae bacterium]|nr:GAF domain-containing protein [Lachnospiraceae bacterium]
MKQTDLKMLEALISDIPRATTIYANASAFLNSVLADVSWVGFYIQDENDNLYLGPFQGNTACVSIQKDHGVCGVSYGKNETVRVDDVSKFPGYISCDAAARSEIVIPLRDKSGTPIAVLDIDSNSLNRFSDAHLEEIKLLEEAAKIIENTISAI